MSVFELTEIRIDIYELVNILIISMFFLRWQVTLKK
jgi:hypothetical protein